MDWWIYSLKTLEMMKEDIISKLADPEIDQWAQQDVASLGRSIEVEIEKRKKQVKDN